MVRRRLIGGAVLSAMVWGTSSAQTPGVQINVNNNGQNIGGDAANEVSAVMHPHGFNIMAAGWREFADADTSRPAAGYAFSLDGGLSWTFPGTITHFPGDYDPKWVSDPVLTIDDDGLMHYVHLIWTDQCDGGPQAIYMSHSGDFGQTWVEPRELISVFDESFVLDKPWVTTDNSAGTGHNNLYVVYVIWGDCATTGPEEIWSQRSTTRGDTWEDPVVVVGDPAELPVCAVDADGDVYCVYLDSPGSEIRVKKSTNAKFNARVMSWDGLGGSCSGLIGQGTREGGVNPAVGAHQPVMAIDTTGGPYRNRVYVAWAGKYDGGDTDIAFSRSSNGGCTWSGPVFLNSDHTYSLGRDQYLPAIAVAPNGRIDVAWYDFRNDGVINENAEIFYCFSKDGGVTWSTNRRLTPQFNAHDGFPERSQKIGEYISIVSTFDNARIIYTGTYGGEQNVYCRRYVHQLPVAIGP